MPETLILNYKDQRIQLADFRAQVDAIFFEASTRKEFKDQEEREAFNWKYLGFYLAHYPEYAWLALKEETVLGYVVGMPFSHDPSLYLLQPHLKAFASSFEKFPAHLHINCHPEARGLGVGKRLVLQLVEQLKSEGVVGLHILTGSSSDNRFFYEKLGFDSLRIEGSILLMGKTL